MGKVKDFVHDTFYNNKNMVFATREMAYMKASELNDNLMAATKEMVANMGSFSGVIGGKFYRVVPFTDENGSLWFVVVRDP